MLQGTDDEARKKELELARGVFKRLGEHNEPWPRRKRKRRKAPHTCGTTSAASEFRMIRPVLRAASGDARC